MFRAALEAMPRTSFGRGIENPLRGTGPKASRVFQARFVRNRCRDAGHVARRITDEFYEIIAGEVSRPRKFAKRYSSVALPG